MKDKSSIQELAIFGGPSEFDEVFHVGRPNKVNRARFLDRVNDMLDRGWLTNKGPYVKELEKRLANHIGVKHCVAVCNATIGLEIAIRALELEGEVIVPSLTFIATAHALQWQEITPVFCDIDPNTHNIDPDRVEELITPKTTGIIGVNLWGRPCDLDALEAIARRCNLKLLYDSAHAFGCTYRGQMIGNFGHAEVFSFHATKFFNTLEGGAIVTNDDELASKIRLMKNFGFQGYDNVVYIGTNGKMNEVSAAMGLTSLEDLDEIININRQNYKLYRQYLSDLPGVSLVTYDEREKNNYQYIVLEIESGVAKITRDLVMEILHSENILARRYFYPGCHNMEPYRSYYPHSKLLLPETEKINQRLLSLPTGTSVGPKEIQYICQIIRTVILNGKEVSEKFKEHQSIPEPINV